MSATIVPVFPLPNVVLFPHLALPLHIFEPRYREMTRDALAGDRRIAVALLRQVEAGAGEPVHPMVCVGRIVQDEELSDGRFNILLHGQRRARIVGELPREGKLYRRVRVREIPEPEQDEPAAPPERDWLRKMASVLKAVLPNAQAEEFPEGTMVDLLAAVLLPIHEQKQRILDTVDVGRRLELLRSMLEDLTHPDVRPWGMRTSPN